MRVRHRLCQVTCGLMLLGLAPLGCERALVGVEPPNDQPHFPAGLALHPDGNLLAVVSSNFDLKYASGSVLLADLTVVNDKLGGADAVVDAADAYVTAAQVPSFGSRPIFVLGGQHMLLPTRSQNLIVELGVEGADANPSFDCGDSESPDGVPLCNAAPRALQLPGNDPFALATYAEGDDYADVVAAALGAPWLYFFRFRSQNDGASRLQQNGLRTLGELAPDGEITGVHGLAHRPAGNGLQTARIFATIERTTSGQLGQAADLVWLDPARRGDAPLGSLGLTEATGARSVRDVTLSPSYDAAFVLVSGPDALVRIDLFRGNDFSPHVGGVVNTCDAPTSATVVSVTPDVGEPVERVLITCFDSETVLAYDALALIETDALRYFGRGPFDVVVDSASTPPRAYVSFFEDDSIGVIDLLDGDGEVRLTPRGRIGMQRPAPEDGR